MLDNANSHQFFAVVATMHHQRDGQTFDDRAQSLPEALLLVPPLSMRQELLSALVDSDVVNQGEIRNAHVVIGPTSEQLDFLWHLIFWILTATGDLGSMLNCTLRVRTL